MGISSILARALEIVGLPTTYPLSRVFVGSMMSVATYFAWTCPCQFYLECHIGTFLSCTLLSALVACYWTLEMIIRDEQIRQSPPKSAAEPLPQDNTVGIALPSRVQIEEDDSLPAAPAETKEHQE